MSYLDSCKVDGHLEITTNLSEITTPENIFYLELVQVILCLALISTTLLLPKITENVNLSKLLMTIKQLYLERRMSTMDDYHVPNHCHGSLILLSYTF